MTILNFDTILTEINGDVVKNKDNEPWSFKAAIVDCVLAPSKEMTSTDSLKSYMLAQKVYAGGDIDFTPEEIVKIKEVIGKHAFPLVSGQIIQYINGVTTVKPSKK